MNIFFQPSSSYTESAYRTALDRFFPGHALIAEAGPAKLQLADYEALDFQAALDHRDRWICAYAIRKALIRKHFLANTVREHVAKHPSSCLAAAIPESWTLEVDYAEFLDDALDEAFELRGELELNAEREEEDRAWFILKPGMSERGAGLRLFSTIDELTAIFEENEQEEDEDEAEDSEPDEDAVRNTGGNGVMTSDMRFFIVQRYLDTPLLLPELDHCKFHIRAYVLCLGSLEVFLHRNMLILSSTQAYARPSMEVEELGRHLTNTCYQGETAAVHAFWQLEAVKLDKQALWQQLKAITGDLFKAASAQRIHFQTLPNAFEIFGLDFLVDAEGQASLLEVNAFPDFAQSGAAQAALVDQVILDMMERVAGKMQAASSSSSASDISAENAFERCLALSLLA